MKLFTLLKNLWTLTADLNFDDAVQTKSNSWDMG